MLTRIPKPNTTQADPHPKAPTKGPVSFIEIKSLIAAATCDPVVNRSASYYDFRERYDNKVGKGSLDALIKQRVSTNWGEQIKDEFVKGIESGVAANLAEVLPLFANTQGRLGAYVNAKVTKTAKPDDQGGSFIDLVIELENTWIADGAPKELQDAPAKITLLVDVTCSADGENYSRKIGTMRDNILLYGEKAKVLCYEDSFGKLGIERPKLIVAKGVDYLHQVGGKLGSCVSQLASDKFVINRPAEFARNYQEYFMDFMEAVGDNARSNIEYLQRLSRDSEKRNRLEAEYKKIVAFVEAYKKTPIVRSSKPVSN